MKKNKQIKSLTHSQPESLKVGDDVFIGDLKSYEGKECPICKENGEGCMFLDGQLCEAHRIYFAIEETTDKHQLVIDRWKDEHGHFRGGINWYSEDKYEYVCECPTLLEVVEKCRDYVRSKNNFDEKIS